MQIFVTRKSGFIFQGFNLLSGTSALENVELPMLYSHAHLSGCDQRERAQKALETAGRGVARTITRISSPVVNSSALPLPAPWSISRRCCWPMSRRGISTARPALRSMGVFQNSTTAASLSVMVTHELDIARYTRRTLIMRDGRIISDNPVTDRLNAETELRLLLNAQQAVQLAS